MRFCNLLYLTLFKLCGIFNLTNHRRFFMKKSVPLVIIKWLLTLAVIGGYYWIVLPPINLQSREFWSFVSFIIIISVVINAFSQIIAFVKDNKNPTKVAGIPRLDFKLLGKPIKYAAILLLAMVILSGFSGYKMGYENITVDTVNYVSDQTDLLHQFEQYLLHKAKRSEGQTNE